LKLKDQVRDVVAEAIHDGILAPKAIYRWFPATSIGESLVVPTTVGTSTSSVSKTFSFPRQNGRAGISAIDWLRPPEQGGDHIAMFVVTAGLETGTRAAEMRKEGRLLASLILQSVAIELAEATAEWVHRRIRQEWGIGDPEGFDVQDVFRTKYRGIRLSFGYPACPSLEDQKPLFDLLQPERIGVELTEGFMMHPEGSVSALVFHHPAGKYYAV
jgi:5-methyltetrahydrofolate--homocysteine methyltransferase